MGDLRFRSLDLQSGDPMNASLGGIYFDLPEGLWVPASVRGEDDVVPEAAGQEPGARIRDFLDIPLEGWVAGGGADREERSEDWLTNTAALKAVMELYLDPGLLEVDGPYLGIPAGATYELNARVIRAIPGVITNRMSFQSWSFQLRCIDSPPEWTLQAT